MRTSERDVSTILFGFDNALCSIRHAGDDVSRENRLETMRRLGELADELERFRARAADTDDGRA